MILHFTLIFNPIVQLNRLTLKCPPIQSQSIYFSKFFWGGLPPDPPTVSILHMLIVLRTITHTQSAQ